MKPHLQSFFSDDTALIIDGGLATHLETLGSNLDDELWSARELIDNPARIVQAHLDYFLAGADCAITASYQASIPGFCKMGLSVARAEALIRRSVELALEARDVFWANPANRPHRTRPLVAASVGPYGAYLANGAEYTGDYGMGEAALVDWHRPRWQLLATSGADLLACETIPALVEARAIHQLLDEAPANAVWISFSCRNDKQISDGAPIAEAVQLFTDHPQVVAIGINCTAPRHVLGLIEEVRRATSKPIVVYPNSGEEYDGALRLWRGSTDAPAFGELSAQWYQAGARLIGGCCRTTPEHIRQIRRRLLK